MSQLNVLIVEDEIDAAEIVNSLLHYYEVNADHVGTAEAAFQALLAHHYDAAVIDIFLPGINGLELMRRIREQPELAYLPTIAITAYGSSGVKKQAIEAGYNRYFSKPLEADDFVQGLRDILS